MLRIRIGGLPIFVYLIGFGILTRATYAVFNLAQPSQPGQPPNPGFLTDIICLVLVGVFVVFCLGIWYFFRRPKPDEPMKEFMNDPWVRANIGQLAGKFGDAPAQAGAAPSALPAGAPETGITAMGNSPNDHVARGI
jgi:hypothetical protein